MLDPRLSRAALALAGCFAAVATAVAAAGRLPGEREVLQAVQAPSDGVLADLARGVDLATGYAGVAAATAALVVGLLVARRTVTAARLAVAVAGAVAGTTLLKRAVERPRPDLLSPLSDVSAFSFPSGHATATAALAVAAALAACGTRWSRGTATAGALLVVVTAVAQLVLVRHHPSDLIGGWLWAAAWATAVWAARPRPA